MRLKKQKKIVLYLQMLQHTKLYLSFSKISASALFLKLFLKFRKFQPRYSYKIYYKKECMCQAAHQYGAPHRTSSKKVLHGERQLIRRLITRPKRLSSLLRLRRLISRLITRLWRLISPLITRLWRLISRLITSPWRVISRLITCLWRLISRLITRLWRLISRLITRLWRLISRLITRLW